MAHSRALRDTQSPVLHARADENLKTPALPALTAIGISLADAVGMRLARLALDGRRAR